MVKYLEDLLFIKTKDTQSAILYAQWNYDKKVVPDALNSVSNLFPHYSLHDESHSITIINNIVRVLGKENIAKLSAIDIWLILEAAYCHDIGMVVPSKKLSETINAKEFIHFFRELIQDTKHSLNEFAIKFEIVNNEIRFKDTLFSLEQNDGVKFILAEFFRRKHSERSKEIIIDPLKELKLVSPRGVIPPRIDKILSNICSCHTKDFSDVMNLSFCEVGIDTENAHPRFVACLLRIGDLLDLDNNRFSEVMLQTLTKVPKDTLIHKEKHLSIESFRVDNDVIEITASCKDYDVATATQHWFDFIDTEISNQMKNWNKIVPSKDLGSLPTIGNLTLKLSTYEAIDSKNKPQFSVDTEKALNLLQGAGLYDGAYKCIREILQNAVDATLIRIWLEHNEEGKDFSSPKSDDFIKLVNQYPIIINIKEKEKEGKWKNWGIDIIDKGTGISTTDLKFLMNTGSSSKNRTRVNIVEDMPIWMRPSGTFGIGFQSIFMLTDLVTIETKSFSDEEFQIIELYSPNSKRNGDILIQKKKTNHSIKPGTKLSFNHKTKAIPDRYTIKGEHHNASRIVGNFDPFSNESMDIELGQIADEIFNFARKSYFPIQLNVNNQNIEIESAQKQFAFFEPKNSLEFNISYGHKEDSYGFSTYYKNQQIEQSI
jgi:Histidine kinase-, DNA gyrase B-, and HSP90-like ATPase